MPRFGLPLQELAARGVQAVELAERSQASTVLLRDGQPVAAIVPLDLLDRIDPPDPGASGADPLLSLCGSCRRDAFVDQYLAAIGFVNRAGT